MAEMRRWTTDADVIARTASQDWSCAGNGAATPEHNPSCDGKIRRGDGYVEYMGEAAAYQSGSRHSMPCAIHFGYVDAR